MLLVVMSTHYWTLDLALNYSPEVNCHVLPCTNTYGHYNTCRVNWIRDQPCVCAHVCMYRGFHTCNFCTNCVAHAPVQFAELHGGIKCLLHKAVTLHKTVILPQIMLARVCAHHVPYENCKKREIPCTWMWVSVHVHMLSVVYLKCALNVHNC